MNVIVVGAGIAGLSTAWSLARAGHSVSIVEQGPIPNPLAASGDHHRIIRRAYGKAGGYARLITEAYDAWDELWADLGESHLDPQSGQNEIPDTFNGILGAGPTGSALAEASAGLLGGAVGAASAAFAGQAAAAEPELAPIDPKLLVGVSRNAPCPCGSGKKFKHCHGAF